MAIRRHQWPSEHVYHIQSRDIQSRACSGTQSHSTCNQQCTRHALSMALSMALSWHSAALSMQSRALRCTYALRSSAIIGPAEPRYAVGTPLTEARSLWGDEGAVVSTCMQPPSRRPRVAGHSRGTLAKVKHARAQSGVIRSSSDAIRSHQEQLTCQGKASPGAIRSHQEQLRCNQESSGAAHLPR